MRPRAGPSQCQTYSTPEKALHDECAHYERARQPKPHMQRKVLTTPQPWAIVKQ